MKTISSGSFGLLIAYIVPGFTALWGVSRVSVTVQSWLGANPTEAPTVAGFFYATLASIAAGLTISTLRWLVIDSIHRRTGVSWPQWDFSQLRRNVAAFQVLIEIHYRYYQFYGGMMVALAIACTSLAVSLAASGRPIWAGLTSDLRSWKPPSSSARGTRCASMFGGERCCLAWLSLRQRAASTYLLAERPRRASAGWTDSGQARRAPA